MVPARHTRASPLGEPRLHSTHVQLVKGDVADSGHEPLEAACIVADAAFVLILHLSARGPRRAVEIILEWFTRYGGRHRNALEALGRGLKLRPLIASGSLAR